MSSTIRSNKSVRSDNSKNFKKTLGGYSKKKKESYNLPEASAELLLEIKEKLKRTK